MQQETATRLVDSMHAECLGGRIGRLHRVVARRFDKTIRPLGLSLPQLEVLSVLMAKGPVAPSNIADTIFVERSTVTRNLAVMERNGWVSIDSSASGRTRAVSITDEGVKLLADAESAWAEAQSSVVADLGPDAVGILDGWLRTLAK